MKKVLYSFLLFFCSFFTTLQAQDFAPQANAPQANAPQANAPQANAPQANAPQTDAFLQRYHELMRFNGKVMVANDEGILYDKGWGMANHAAGKPFSEESLFNIAGLSEQFTAYIALQLINQGKLSLQKPVKAYLRDVSWGNKANITLHHLLSHTSGLPDYPHIHELPEKQFTSVSEMKAYLGNVSLQDEPGKSFSYSKLNYNLVGLVLQTVTGKSYSQLVEEWITKPLNMQHTFVAGTNPEKDQQVVTAYVGSFQEGWKEAPAIHPVNLYAAQGIVSTTADLLLWYRNLKGRLLKNPNYRLLFTPYLEDWGWGYKVVSGPNGKVKQLNSLDGVFNHGFNAWASLDEAQDLIIIVLSNNRHPVSGEIGEGLRNIFTGKKYEMPLAREIVRIDPALLNEYVGSYTISENFTLKVLKENDRLFVDDGMNPKTEVYPQSTNQFFLKDKDVALEFVRDGDGKVAEVVLYDGFMNGMHVKKNR